jgi:transposase
LVPAAVLSPCLWQRELPAVGAALRIWRQQYYQQDTQPEQAQLRWREADEQPPCKQLILSPDDLEARNRTKRETNWSGYAVHLTETCNPGGPNLITNVETTPATTADVDMTGVIHQKLADRALLPAEQLVDTAYVSADHLLDSQNQYRLDLIGPVPGSGKPAKNSSASTSSGPALKAPSLKAYGHLNYGEPVIWAWPRPGCNTWPSLLR